MNTEQRMEVCLRHERENFLLDVDFSVSCRGVIAIFGPSGCGKTTLLRLIAGLEQGQGYLKLCDEVWQDETVFIPTHERPIGYVFQESSLFPHLSVLRNLLYGYRRIPYRQRHVKLEHAVELLGIGHLLQRKPQGLSGGERQRVAIARALLTSPKLLLMDEPISALDQNSKAEIMPYLQRLHSDLAIPVLYVSHAADEVAQLADHLVLMKNGRVESQGSINKMRKHLHLTSHISTSDESTGFEATVIDYDDAFHITYLEAGGVRLSVIGIVASVGESVELSINAEDISLSLEPIKDSSILNMIPVRLGSMAERKPAHVQISLDSGLGPLLAHTTRKSVKELVLHPGKEVYAVLHNLTVMN
ncbi:MAG: molybdenum ABC transporter ATP-binding protein [Gammaproteobacteria bacterium]|nr:molybdenum ABC transporter ATP-binding protein [Gammaproteobacteria bacterium]